MADRNGFTLVELLVCIALVSVLLAIALPALGSWRQRACLRTEVASLVASLHLAKTEAVKSGAYVVLEAQGDGYTVYVDNSSTPSQAGDWVRQADERILVNYRIRDGITLTSNFTSPDDKARFSPRPDIKAGRFIMTDVDGHRMDVILSRVGRIRVQ